YSRKWGMKPLFAVCRTQYASVCMWRGDWDEAERELTNACDELAICRPGMTTDGLARFGELRRRQGRLDEAAALFDRCSAHPIASLGRAARGLDHGEAHHAAELAERHLRRMPAKNRTERAGALELLIRARTAAGGARELDRARTACDELRSIAADAQTPPLRASASVGAGLIALAAGDVDRARTDLEDAVDLFEQSSAPFEAALARLDLASALEQLGRIDAAVADVNRAIDTLTRLDARFEVSRARAILDRLSPQPAKPANARGANGLTMREVEVLRLIAG